MSKNTINKQHIRKKINNDMINNALKKNLLYQNNIFHSHNLFKTKEDDDYDYMSKYSNELLDENIKLSPFINSIPCFTIKNENSKKEISTRLTFCNSLKTKISYMDNKINQNYDDNNDINNNNKKNKIKINNKNLKKSYKDKKFFRANSPNLERNKKNIFNSYNQQIHTDNNIDNNRLINYEIFLDNKKKLITKINKKNNSKKILSPKKRPKAKNYLYYSLDNKLNFSTTFEKKKKEIEERKKRKNKLINLLGQKINVADMKIEILQNYIKNKNLNSIKKKIEYNRIYCKNDLKNLKEIYYNNIQKHLEQIRYLKMRLSNCEENFLNIYKHKEIIKNEELNFKIEKVNLIEKIIVLQKFLHDILNRDSTTNDTNRFEDSFEEQTIKDFSFTEYSIAKDKLGNNYKRYNKYNINKAYFNEEVLYKKKFTRNRYNEGNQMTSKLIKTVREKKNNK